jgi:hypothetical protein
LVPKDSLLARLLTFKPQNCQKWLCKSWKNYSAIEGQIRKRSLKNLWKFRGKPGKIQMGKVYKIGFDSMLAVLINGRFWLKRDNNDFLKIMFKSE